jgi:hypothetical protein
MIVIVRNSVSREARQTDDYETGGVGRKQRVLDVVGASSALVIVNMNGPPGLAVE